MKNKSGVQEIIDKNGNSFHSRVVKLLREQKWTVIVSPYYSDNFTNKPREIDIIAEKKVDINKFTHDSLGMLNIRLFVECKRINEGDTVFWFDIKDKNRAIERIMSDTGMKYKNDNFDIKKHHYFSDIPVAKLFASEKNRGEDNEWMSKAINQNLNALVYYRNQTDLIPENLNRPILWRLSYPIIVVNTFDHFFRINMADDNDKVETIKEPFQLEVNYAYIDRNKKGCNEYFLIDVVSIDKLQNFLLMIENSEIKEVEGKIFFEQINNNKS